MNHEEIYEGTWEEKHIFGIFYLRRGCINLCIYMLNIVKTIMPEMTKFGMKDCLSLPYLRWNFFNDERDTGKGDEVFSTYIDKYSRYFVRKSLKSGKVGTFIQIFESSIAEDIFRIIKKEFRLVTDEKYEIVHYYVNYIEIFLKKWRGI